MQRCENKKAQFPEPLAIDSPTLLSGLITIVDTD